MHKQEKVADFLFIACALSSWILAATSLKNTHIHTNTYTIYIRVHIWLAFEQMFLTVDLHVPFLACILVFSICQFRCLYSVRIEYLTYAAVQVSTSIDIGTIRIKYSKMKGRWSEGLLHTMRDPNSVVISTDKLVAIKDKYPKAQIHYLVLPYDNIPSIFHVGLNKMNIVCVY